MVTRRRLHATSRRATTILACVLALGAARAAAQTPVEHQLDVTLAPAAGHIAVRDRITLPADTPTRLRFALNAGLAPQVEERGIALSAAEPAELPQRRYYTLTLPPGARRVTLRYAGRLVSDDDEQSAVLSDAGAYLDDVCAWVPEFGERLVTFTLTVRLPAGWDAVSQGQRTRATRDNQGASVTWQERAPQQAVSLVAARFHRYRASLPGGVEALVYLRTADARLADTYLAATRKYLTLYQRLLGPYPYAKFALVEHFRQTGLGLPSFTLLGARVIRLPFIPETSYPHEILHNWWGNGVYVDHRGGNWSEGLTTYLADHLQAETAGQDDVYRRDQLARYASQARGVRDFALEQFHGRHDEASQAVGYGKGLMLFHMLRQRLGDATFLAGLRRFYMQQRFRYAGYAELRAAFEEASGQSLKDFFHQWVARIGAPRLVLEEVTVRKENGRERVRGLLKQIQRDTPYALDVPLVLERAGAPPLETTLHMPGRALRFELALDGQATRLTIDPRFDLFRRPAPAELPASFGEAFGAAYLTLVLPARAPEALRAAYEALAREWQRPGVALRLDDNLEQLPSEGGVWLLGWDNRWRTALAPFAPEAQIADDAVVIAGERHARATHGVALALRRGEQPLAWLGADTPQAVARLTRSLPRYLGKSYVVFENATAARPRTGQWPVRDSPLQRTLAAEPVAPLALPPRAVLGAGGE
jgi:hypothetical protein